MRALLALAVVVAVPCFAQDELSAPPPPPSDVIQPDAAAPQAEPAQAPQPEPAPRRSSGERCFSLGHVWVEPSYHPVVVRTHVSEPAPSPSGDTHGATSVGNGGGGSVGGGGGGDGKAMLILAVVAVAILPIIIYAVDEEAPDFVKERFDCPVVSFDGFGGVDAMPSGPFVPAAAGRFSFAYSVVGGDFTFDSVPGLMGALSTHFLLRPMPKNHVEGAAAIGYRRVEINGAVRDGVEIGLFHRYVFWRDGLRVVGLELRPALSFGTRGIDAILEAAFIVPILDFLHLRAGGRAYSFGNSVMWGLNAGLTFSL